MSQAQLGALIGAQQSEVARWESGNVVPSGATLLAIQDALGHRSVDSQTHGKATAMGALGNYIAMIGHVRTRPISDSHRDELAKAQTSLEQTREHVDSILSQYDINTLIDRPDTNLLRGRFGPFGFSLTRGPSAVFPLGTSDTGSPVIVDLDKTPHGFIVSGMTELGERIGGRIAAAAIDQDPHDVEIWTITPDSFVLGQDSVSDDARGMEQRAAEALRAAYHQRELPLVRANMPDFASYWKYQQSHTGAPRMRRVLLVIASYEMLRHHGEFERALAEVLANARTLGIHVQLHVSVLPSKFSGRDNRINSYMSYHALLHTEDTDAYARVFSPPLGKEIDALLTEPGTGVLYSADNTDGLVRFHCGTTR